MLFILLIFILLVIIVSIGIKVNYEWENFFGGLATALLIILAVSLILWPITYIDRQTSETQFKQFSEHIKYIRGKTHNTDDIVLASENMHLQREIIKWNQWLASNQFLAKNLWFGMYTPNSVLKLEFIR